MGETARPCYRYRGVWIPGCYARAHSDRDCTCPVRSGSVPDIERLREEVAELRREVEAIRKVTP